MITTRVDIILAINAPNLYRFGYAETNDPLNVVNWQVGNPTFYNVSDGTKYFFVENLYNKALPIIAIQKNIICGECKLVIATITKKAADPLNTDWEDIQIEEQEEATTDPLEADWEDIQTTECQLEIETILKQIHK